MVVFLGVIRNYLYQKVYRNGIVCTQLHSHIPNALYLCVQIVYQMLRAEITLLKRVAILVLPYDKVLFPITISTYPLKFFN